MDFKDQVVQLSDNIKKQKDKIATEEATKNAFIMPMIAALGYDVFNPFEVVPEMDCDLIKKKGEKIDYAIMKDENPILLIECKYCKQDLNLHDTQLQKYFVASKARFGVLTNGIEYRFYTDLEKINIMDEKPFLVVNMLDLSDADIEQLKKFHKSYYNEEDVLILRKSVDVSRITYKDYKSYFVVNIDNSQWFWICRVSIGARKKQIGIPPDQYKSCEWIQIDNMDDIFKYADRLEEALKMTIKSCEH